MQTINVRFHFIAPCLPQMEALQPTYAPILFPALRRSKRICNSTNRQTILLLLLLRAINHNAINFHITMYFNRTPGLGFQNRTPHARTHTLHCTRSIHHRWHRDLRPSLHPLGGPWKLINIFYPTAPPYIDAC